MQHTKRCNCLQSLTIFFFFESGPLVTLDPAGLRAMYDVNAVGILTLYRAFN